MILLNGHSLTPSRKLRPESLSLSLNERESTATMALDDVTGITVNSWVQDDTEPGKGIVWRVKSISQAFASGTYTLQLEHMISKLKERILFGETTPAVLAGNSKAKTVAAKKAVQYILAQQNDWVLGSFAFSDENPYKFDGDTLFDALNTISDSLEGCWWTYDFSTYPFKLNFTQKSTSVGTVLRAGRNLTAITKSIDRSGMYTRFYPIGKDDLHVDGDYVSRNAGTWGTIAHTETDQSITTKAELTRWAKEKLKKHADPVVTIDVEGLELAEATGETLDRMRLGRLCKIPLADFGTEITETITALSYSDKLRKPEQVKVTLANERQDVTKIIADAIKRSGGGGRTAARQQKEDHAWFEDTDTHVAMVAEGIVGKDKDGNPNWARLSKLIVDGNGIMTTVQDLSDTAEQHATKIQQNERNISLEATARANGDTDLLGKIEVEAGRINLVVTGTGPGAKVNAAGICLAINKGGSTATINADRIYLLGETIAETITADYISTKIASIPTLRGISASFSGNVSATGILGGQIYVGSGTSYTNISDPLKDVQISGPSNNTYKLQYRKFSQSAWQDAGSFSRAVASWTMGWSGGTFTAKANPQDQSCSTQITQGTASWSGGTATIPILGTDSDNPNYSYATGRNVVITNSWSYPSTISTSSTDPGNYEKMYTMSKGYNYGYFSVTVNGQAKRFVVHLTS